MNRERAQQHDQCGGAGDDSARNAKREQAVKRDFFAVAPVKKTVIMRMIVMNMIIVRMIMMGIIMMGIIRRGMAA